MQETIFVRGEKPPEERNPSNHPEFCKRYPTLFVPLQTEAYRQVQAGHSCALVAPTSSGKTLAVAAPLFEAGRPAVFVLPFRSLILDHSQELPRIARIFGISEDRFARIWGGSSDADIAEAIKRDYLLVTPDKLLSLLPENRKRNAAALSILKKYDFVFDEIHTYNAMMVTSLRYFLRSVRYWKGSRGKSGFYFLSATFPPDVWTLLQEELGLTSNERIEGISYTGGVELLIRPYRTVTRTTDGAVPIARDMETLKITRNVVGIFNSPYRAWQISQQIGGLLFVGQDKMGESERRDNFDLFSDSPEDHALIGSSAIEAGVDFEAHNLVIEESHQDSFVQRFGRAARSGKNAFVLAYSDTLHARKRDGLLANQYTRREFLEELREVVHRRESKKIFNNLAAYAYYNFWDGDPDFPMEPADRGRCELLRRKGVSKRLLAFRSLIPYTHYQSGESISYQTLFRKNLPVIDGKVSGAPRPEYYFTRPPREPVWGDVQCVADQEEVDDSLVLLAKVRFTSSGIGLGTHWVLLELFKPDLTEVEDDNIRLCLEGGEYGRRLDGGGISELAVRFHNVDV